MIDDLFLRIQTPYLARRWQLKHFLEFSPRTLEGNIYLGCYFDHVVIFTPYLREIIHFDEHIFQKGLVKNHQLVNYCP